MNEDILKMLGLDDKPKDKPAAEPVPDELHWHKPEENEAEEMTDTVLKVNDWDLEQGERIAESKEEKDVNAMTDFFAAAFHYSPEVAGKCIDQLRQHYIETLLETSDYKVLHNDTMGRVTESELAAIKLAHGFKKLLKKDKEGKELDELDYIAAAGTALEGAAEDVDEFKETCRGLGGAESTSHSTMDAKAVAATFRKVRNNETLKRICELAGRYRRMAQAKQRQKVTHGYDEMMGVELSGDISRLLPSELAMLADEDLELDAMRRIVEREAMSRQFRGIERVGKGPIIVCVDESGSMSGEPVCNAKAFALAMAWIASHQRRPCILLGHTGHTRSTSVELLPGKWNQGSLLIWLEHFFGMGTDMDVPFELVPKITADKPYKKKIDVICLTDALSRVPDNMAQTFNAWKKENNARCTGIVIGWSTAGDLQKCCDEVHAVNSISVDEESIQKCLSI